MRKVRLGPESQRLCSRVLSSEVCLGHQEELHLGGEVTSEEDEKGQTVHPPFTGEESGAPTGLDCPKISLLQETCFQPQLIPTTTDPSPPLHLPVPAATPKLNWERNDALIHHYRRMRSHWARGRRQGWSETTQRWFPMCWDLTRS